jgi:hypothetical protein
MAFLEEAQFCGAEEYNTGVSKRITALELRQEDFYMMMFRLKGDQREAAKLAVKMLKVARPAGITVVKFAVVDTELKEGYVATEKLTDDFVAGAETIAVRDREFGGVYNVSEAYFKDYFEDQFGDMLEECNSQSVGADHGMIL